MKKQALAVLFLLFTSTVFAAGTMTIEGKISGRTEKTFSIQSQKQIFVINKSALSHSQIKALDAKKSGDAVTLDVPMTGISDVSDVKKK